MESSEQKRLAGPARNHPMHPSNLFSAGMPRHQTSPVVTQSPFLPPPLPPPVLPPTTQARPRSRSRSSDQVEIEHDTSSPPPSPSSSSTIDSWELPSSHTITPSSSLRARTNGMHVAVELTEGKKHRRGKVGITNAPKIDGKSVRHTFDVGKMREGEERVIARPDREEEMVVNLTRGGRGGVAQVVMKWD